MMPGLRSSMSNANSAKIFVGVDVSKATLDVSRLDIDKVLQIDNSMKRWSLFLCTVSVVTDPK